MFENWNVGWLRISRRISHLSCCVAVELNMKGQENGQKPSVAINDLGRIEHVDLYGNKVPAGSK